MRRISATLRRLGRRQPGVWIQRTGFFSSAGVVPAGTRVDWDNRITVSEQYFELKPGAVLYLGNWSIQLGTRTRATKYDIKYDIDEVGLFAKANPGIDASRYAIGVLGKPPVPRKKE